MVVVVTVGVALALGAVVVRGDAVAVGLGAATPCWRWFIWTPTASPTIRTMATVTTATANRRMRDARIARTTAPRWPTVDQRSTVTTCAWILAWMGPRPNR